MANDQMDLIGSTLRKGQGTLEEKMGDLGDVVQEQKNKIQVLCNQVSILERYMTETLAI